MDYYSHQNLCHICLHNGTVNHLGIISEYFNASCSMGEVKNERK